MPPVLDDDSLLCVLECLACDSATLSICAQVSTQYNNLASKLLYAHVVWSPQFKPRLNLRDDGLPPSPSMLASACLPRNAPHVLFLEIGGFLSSRAAHADRLASYLLNAVRLFVNLKTCSFCPKKYPPNLFLHSVPELKHLTRLSVNSSCTDTDTTAVLVALSNLRSLTIKDASRAVLDVLPDWVSTMVPTLTELHLQDNCGSVTPGVLRNLEPHLGHLKSFRLHLSYSLADKDVASFLEKLPSIESLSLQYYWQYAGIFSTSRRLLRLRSFSVRFLVIRRRAEADRLARWIRGVIYYSPLEQLRISCDAEKDDSIHLLGVAFDSLIDHLTGRHAGTLRHIDAPSAFVSIKTLKALLTKCQSLKILSISCGLNALHVLEECIDNLQVLHTVSFRIRHVKERSYEVSDDTVRNIMRRSSLRRMTVNAIYWEGAWTTVSNEVAFQVSRIQRSVPPWERSS
ncbi:hypothetical protein CPB85DRAFT_1281794 [Mucidula mucida]|nr:hypothetical protein CPB85DRAFT_1281794 [Mucidula mucida]